MKKLLFSAVTLDVGGIETALVTLLNYLSEEYEITLVLEKKQGLFLNTLNKKIKIIEFTPNNNKMTFIRKMINFIKQIDFKSKYGNKFDFSCSYATYSNPASFVARAASKNCILWCHMDYLSQYKGDKNKVVEFFKEKHYKEFSKLVFVSEKSKQTFLQVFPEMKEKVLHINNLINYKEIEEKSLKEIDSEEKPLLNKKDGQTIFLNYGRHDEEQKKLSRIIEVAKMLKNDNKDFKILFVGEGKDTQKYRQMVRDLDIEETVLFLGKKKNPFPYIKLADCILLTSDYEGSPVVFTETMVLNKPIITTNVAGSEQIKDKFGFVAEKNINDIYEKMNLFMRDGFEIKEKFDAEKYNEDIISKVKKII